MHIFISNLHFTIYYRYIFVSAFNHLWQVHWFIVVSLCQYLWSGFNQEIMYFWEWTKPCFITASIRLTWICWYTSSSTYQWSNNNFMCFRVYYNGVYIIETDIHLNAMVTVNRYIYIYIYITGAGKNWFSLIHKLCAHFWGHKISADCLYIFICAGLISTII